MPYHFLRNPKKKQLLCSLHSLFVSLSWLVEKWYQKWNKETKPNPISYYLFLWCKSGTKQKTNETKPNPISYYLSWLVQNCNQIEFYSILFFLVNTKMVPKSKKQNCNKIKFYSTLFFLISAKVVPKVKTRTETKLNFIPYSFSWSMQKGYQK